MFSEGTTIILINAKHGSYIVKASLKGKQDETGRFWFKGSGKTKQGVTH